METLKFKVGDKVRVKSLEWYNANKYGSTNTSVSIAELGFVEAMASYCGKVLKITAISSDYYRTDGNIYCWQDWMLEDEVVTEEKETTEDKTEDCKVLKFIKSMETRKMTLKEAQDFVKNTKYIVWSEEESCELQEKLFEIGCEWLVVGQITNNTEHPFLFVDENLKLTYTHKESCQFFDESTNICILTDDVLCIEIEQERPKFDPNTLKPFDKVLVRDSKNEKWRARFFDLYEDGEFGTTCNCYWKNIIPYNEETKHLVGTADEAPDFYNIW
jgi:hypothetical protein